MNKGYKEIKMFDLDDMPENVKAVIVEKFKGTRNDSYIIWYVFNEGKFEHELPENSDIIYKHHNKKAGNYIYYIRGDDPISDWLYENGADPKEDIIIKYWW